MSALHKPHRVASDTYVTNGLQDESPYLECFEAITEYVRARLALPLHTASAGKSTAPSRLPCVLIAIKIVGDFTDEDGFRSKRTEAWDLHKGTITRIPWAGTQKKLEAGYEHMAGMFQTGFLENLHSANMTIDARKIRDAGAAGRSFKARFSVCSEQQPNATYEVRALFHTTAAAKTIADLAKFTNFAWSCESPCVGTETKTSAGHTIYKKAARPGARDALWQDAKDYYNVEADEDIQNYIDWTQSGEVGRDMEHVLQNAKYALDEAQNFIGSPTVDQQSDYDNYNQSV